MGKINMGKVVLGGLLAGLVINIGEFILNMPILGKDFEAAMQALNLPTVGDSAIAVFVVMGFALGIVAVWIYAAIRSRFGPGPKTAIMTGFVVWLLAYLYPSVGMLVMGFFPARMIMIGIIWGLFEVPIALLAGAWLYKEE